MAELTLIGNEMLSVGVNALGAETQFIRDAEGQDWLWDGQAEWWTGRSPLLFPIVGGAPEDQIAIGDFRAEMAKHGFARKSEFALLEAGAEYCVHELRDSEATREVYPFAFALRVTHRLDGAGLTVSVTVENLSEDEMPFGFGFHPAFRWPLPGATGAHRIELENGAEPALYRIADGGLIAKRPLPSPFVAGGLELEHSQYDNDAMIFPEGAGSALRMVADNGVSLRFSWDGLPNLALWQKPGAPYLCLEPWHGMAAWHGAGPQMMDRPFSIALAAGDNRQFSWTVSLTSG